MQVRWRARCECGWLAGRENARGNRGKYRLRGDVNQWASRKGERWGKKNGGNGY